MDEDVEARGGDRHCGGPLGSPMHTISKKLAKREKRARFPTSEREKYFGVASGSIDVTHRSYVFFAQVQ